MKQKSKSPRKKYDTVCVVAAHPDDEVLGCGGAIARHAGEGDAVHVLFMTDGVSARGKNIKEAKERRLCAQRSGKILGVKTITHLDFPDNQMDTVPLLDVAKKLEKLFSGMRPDIVYTHHHGDLNIDHRLTQQAVLTAARPYPGQTIRRVLGFEVLSSTEWQLPSPKMVFTPQMYVDIGKYWTMKERACTAYSREFRPYPHPRSLHAVEILASYRGICCGLEYAEAFEVYRNIV